MELNSEKTITNQIMKKALLFLTLVFVFTLSSKGQQEKQQKGWEQLTWLNGKWIGDGSGTPGQGTGTFTFSFDLDKNIIVRKSHTEFPATNERPASVHDDLMVIYTDPAGQKRAIYFDNEGHTINYLLSLQGKSVVLTSEKTGNMPFFRLTYTPAENDAVDTSFDMSQDGMTFKPYIQGRSRRVN